MLKKKWIIFFVIFFGALIILLLDILNEKSEIESKPVITDGLFKVAFEVINDSAISDKKLVEAIEIVRLHLVTEPPDFWIEICNNESFSVVHRTRCFFELFRRHVPVGTKMSRLLQWNGVSWWFDDDNIRDIGVASVLPFDPLPNSTIIEIRPPFAKIAPAALYISIEGESYIIFKRWNMIKKRGCAGYSKKIDLTINQIGYSENYLPEY